MAAAAEAESYRADQAEEAGGLQHREHSGFLAGEVLFHLWIFS